MEKFTSRIFTLEEYIVSGKVEMQVAGYSSIRVWPHGWTDAVG